MLKIRPSTTFIGCEDPPMPDYNDLNSWIAYPGKESKALLKPSDIEEQFVNDVPTFFIHPTSYFGGDNWNADIQDIRSRQLVEELVLPAQASVFNHLGDIYAPIYRQATFYSFLTGSNDAYAALDLAFADVVRAFKKFISEIGNKPFFIAGHSQGSLLGIRLLATEIENNITLRQRLVAAYLPGYKIPKVKFDKEFSFIKKGEKPNQVHCVLAWDTFLTGFNPLHHIDNASIWMKTNESESWRKRMTFIPFCINPITWDVDQPEAQAHQNMGAVVNEYAREPFQWTEVGDEQAPGIHTLSLTKPQPGLVSAKVGVGNILSVSKPKGMIYNIGKLPGGNYHVYDYTFFYMDIRYNASLRWEKYKSLYLA